MSGINPNTTKKKIKNVGEVFRPPLAEGIAKTNYGKLKFSCTLKSHLEARSVYKVE